MTSVDRRKTSLFDNKKNRIAMLGLLVVAIAATLLSPIGSIFLGQSSTASAQQASPTEDDNGAPPAEEEFTEPLAAAVDMNSSRIIVSGSAASPGEEAGPFQILRILPERTDGKIYVGEISFTATAPIYVLPAFGFDAQNQTLDHGKFGDLIRFPSEGSFSNSSLAPPEIAYGPIMPQYAQIVAMPEGSLPQVYSATVPFAGELLEVGNINGTNFLISYTVFADVYDTNRVSAIGPAMVNTTGQAAAQNPVSIVYGAVEMTTTAYSPNPITISRGDNVTWTNNDFLPHTVTSGTPDQMETDEAGQEFDSGFIGTRSSFTHTFENSGDFDYFCALHPNMVGAVSVN